jgi:hypothetical protein
MRTVAEQRKSLYDYHRKYYPYYDELKWYSYDKIKIHIYLNLSPYLAYLFQRISIHPNAVTITYAFWGILGGIFLAIPIRWLILTGVILFFFRPFLDWCDGLLARETNRTSVTGDVLDSWGAFAGWIFLWAGLGLYVAEKFYYMGLYLSNVSVANIFFCLAPVIPALVAVNLLTYSKIRLYDNHIVKNYRDYLKKGQKLNRKTTETKKDFEDKYKKILSIFRTINNEFSHTHRNVDLLCLLILLELFLPFFIIWVVLLVFLAWQIIFFAASFYLITCKGWVEKDLQEKLKQTKKLS